MTETVVAGLAVQLRAMARARGAAGMDFDADVLRKAADRLVYLEDQNVRLQAALTEAGAELEDLKDQLTAHDGDGAYPLCACGHEMTDHDVFGCLYGEGCTCEAYGAPTLVGLAEWAAEAP